MSSLTTASIGPRPSQGTPADPRGHSTPPVGRRDAWICDGGGAGAAAAIPAAAPKGVLCAPSGPCRKGPEKRGLSSIQRCPWFQREPFVEGRRPPPPRPWRIEPRRQWKRTWGIEVADEEADAVSTAPASTAVKKPAAACSGGESKAQRATWDRRSPMQESQPAGIREEAKGQPARAQMAYRYDRGRDPIDCVDHVDPIDPGLDPSVPIDPVDPIHPERWRETESYQSRGARRENSRNTCCYIFFV